MIGKCFDLFKGRKGFTIVEVLVAIGILVVAITLLAIFWPSAPPPPKTTSVTGVFTMVPATLGNQSTVVKFQLTDATGKGINKKVVRYKLSNIKASQFTAKSQSKTKANGISTISIRAKKNRTGKGTITATVILKTKKGLVRAKEVSKEFEIDGTTGPSTY